VSNETYEIIELILLVIILILLLVPYGTRRR
jgi:hypothetical protein